MKKRPLTPIASYLMVALLGVAGGWLVKRGGGNEPVRDAATLNEKAKPQGGKELLAAFVSASDPAVTLEERLEALEKSTEVSSDPARAFHKKFEAWEHLSAGLPDDDPRMLELAVLLGRWVDADAKAALAFLSGSYGSKNGLSMRLAQTYLWRIAKQVVAENGVRDFVTALPEEGDLVLLTSRSIFEEVGKRASLADLEWLRTNAPWFFTDGSVGKNIAREWPLERRDELLAALDPASAAAAIAQMVGRMDGGGEWIARQLKDGVFAPEVVKSIAEGELAQYYRTINGVSIEQRLEIMGLLGRLEMGEDRVKNEMIFNSIRNRFFLRDAEDSLYGLRHGSLTAAEVVDRARPGMPDPGKHAGEFNSQMFRTLAEENLPAAMQMLSGMPPAQQEMEKALAVRWWFREADPDDFYHLVRDLNATGGDAAKGMMQDAWNDKARGHIDRYGAGYLEWIKALPDGVDKTQALRSVVVAGGNARLAAQARNLLNGKS